MSNKQNASINILQDKSQNSSVPEIHPIIE